MKTGMWLGLAAAATFTIGMHAQAPTGATGMCKDGTYTQAGMRKDACNDHGGVETWYPKSGGARKAPGGKLNPAPAGDAASQVNLDGTVQKTELPARKTPAAPVNGRAMVRPQAPGGGPGLVWVDTKANKFYCAADPNYGRTEKGKYVSESDAQTSGAQIAKNQHCSLQ